MTYVQRLDGPLIDLDDAGIRTRDFIVDSPEYDHATDKVEGADGVIDLGTTIGPREINVLFRIVADDWIDFGLFRDEIFNIFRSKEPFYIIEKRNKGKRWLVKTRSAYRIPQRNVLGNFDISFIAHSGLSESVGTTLVPYEWDADTWQWGMGIPYDDYKYEHTTNEFVIYNAGTELINPRSPHMGMRIEVKATTSDYIELVNHTTNETYRYNGSLSTNDTLVIDGLRTTKNSLSVYRDTNKKFITLSPGENAIEVRGAQVESILFDFRFYYV